MWPPYIKFCIWTQREKKKELIGVVTAFHLHPGKMVALVIEHMRWKPGLSARATVEAALEFLRQIGENIQLIGYSNTTDYKFFDKLRKCGRLRRIGKQQSGFAKMVTAWETPKSLLKS
jgi:hypothetical protein